MARFIKVRNNHVVYPVRDSDLYDTAPENVSSDSNFIRIEVWRYDVTQNLIFGEISVHCPDGLIYYFRSLELPWLDNRTSISCIPNGLFATSYKKSPSFGRKMLYLSVPGRTGIMFHGGHSTAHTRGCILIKGCCLSSMNDFPASTSSDSFYKLIDSLAIKGYKFFIDVHC